LNEYGVGQRPIPTTWTTTTLLKYIHHDYRFVFYGAGDGTLYAARLDPIWKQCFPHFLDKEVFSWIGVPCNCGPR
jgi:hypothetical protein